jgi:hypothetical protein
MVAGGLPTGTHEDADYMLMLGRWALGVLGILNSASKENLKPCMPTLCIVLHFGEVFAGKVNIFFPSSSRYSYPHNLFFFVCLFFLFFWYSFN